MKKFLASLPLIGIICLFTFGIIIASGCEKLEPTSKLDSYELHYDADGYFLLINDNDNLMGVYDGPEALEHFYLDLNCTPALAPGDATLAHAGRPSIQTLMNSQPFSFSCSPTPLLRSPTAAPWSIQPARCSDAKTKG